MTANQRQDSEEAFATMLARCPDDRDQTGSTTVHDADLRNLQAALTTYRTQTLQWAQRRSAGQPSLAAAAHRQQRWAALPQWSLALVAFITIAGGVAHLAVNRAAVEQPYEQFGSSVVLADMPATAADIAADNLLLSSIDAELNYHAASPVNRLRTRDGKTKGAAGLQGVTD